MSTSQPPSLPAISLSRGIEYFADLKVEPDESLKFVRALGSFFSDQMRAVHEADVVALNEGRCLLVPFTGEKPIDVNGTSLAPGKPYGKLYIPPTSRVSIDQARKRAIAEDTSIREALKALLGENAKLLQTNIKNVLAALAAELTEGTALNDVQAFGLTIIGGRDPFTERDSLSNYTAAANFRAFSAGQGILGGNIALFISRANVLSSFSTNVGQ